MNRILKFLARSRQATYVFKVEAQLGNVGLQLGIGLNGLDQITPIDLLGRRSGERDRDIDSDHRIAVGRSIETSAIESVVLFGVDAL